MMSMGKVVHRPCSKCISSIQNWIRTQLSSLCQLGLGVWLSHLRLSHYIYLIVGIPTHYGKTNQWKQERSNISILLSIPTKPSHKSRSFKPQTWRNKFINDGHGPDSAQKLIPKGPSSPQKKSKVYLIIKNTFGEPYYLWEQNSY